MRARTLELVTDPAKGFSAAEALRGVHIEQALGRTISGSSDPAADFIDPVLGKLSLKGPIPPAGSVGGLAASAIKDANLNTATQALFIDLTGLSAEYAALVKNMVQAAVANARKGVYFLE